MHFFRSEDSKRRRRGTEWPNAKSFLFPILIKIVFQFFIFFYFCCSTFRFNLLSTTQPTWPAFYLNFFLLGFLIKLMKFLLTLLFGTIGSFVGKVLGVSFFNLNNFDWKSFFIIVNSQIGHTKVIILRLNFRFFSTNSYQNVCKVFLMRKSI